MMVVVVVVVQKLVWLLCLYGVCGGTILVRFVNRFVVVWLVDKHVAETNHHHHHS